jgi:hypothetical protein
LGRKVWKGIVTTALENLAIPRFKGMVLMYIRKRGQVRCFQELLILLNIVRTSIEFQPIIK